MKKENLIEALLTISHDQWGKVTSIDTPLVDASSFLKKCVDDGMERIDATELLMKMHRANYVDVTFGRECPETIRVTEIGKQLYMECLRQTLTNF